jgi:energy-coupling factor transport system ATP-binding protein
MLLVHDLSFRYPGVGEKRGKRVHDGLSLAVAAGEMTVLFGAADEGKTTLARIAAGLVPRFTGGALSGTVLVAGADIRHSLPYELMEDVGVVAQDSDEQIFTTRCDTEIAFALESLGLPRARMVERVEECLRRMGLFEMRARNPSTLSGGEKKRLLLACLTAIGPKLWILDESLEELDLSWKGAILDALAGTDATVLILDSRWSAILAERGRRFALLAGGRITSSADRCDAPAFHQALSREGILPREESRVGRDVSAEVQLKMEGVQFRFPDNGGFSLGIDSLELRSGEICALLGSNGSGKTTLGRILCGLLEPQAGVITLRTGSGFRPASTEERNGRVGYLFQNPDHQIYLPTVRDELSLGLRRQGMSRGEIDRRIEEAVELFSLPDPASPPALMSYGGRRRLQAATSYLLPREILILDEIDSGLSCREVERLLDALFLRGPGILLITHDMALAKSVSDRILVMQGGRLAGDYRSAAFDRLDVSAGGASAP